MAFAVRLAAGSPEPLHRQVYDALRGAILARALEPGDRLPATRSLAEQLAVSRTTVAEAYNQLRAEGYVHAMSGSGTYVSPDISRDSVPVLEASIVGEARQHRSLRLSGWGKRITADEYRPLLRPAEPETYQYDFRPHLIAHDRFPWDAWRGAVDRALGQGRANLLAYPPSAGHPALLEAIADHVAKFRAVRCSPEDVVVVNGSQQGVNLLAQLLIDAGDRVAVEDPSYPSARLAFEARASGVTRVPVDEEGIIVEALTQAGAHRMVLVTPSHQYPTGATLSLSRRLALLEVAERTGCLVIEDDYDSEFRYEGRPLESLQGLDTAGQVTYAGTFSKSLLAGLRIGFMILPRALVSPFVSAKSVWDSGTAMLEQVALAEFMRSGDLERHIRRMRRLYRSRRDVLLTSIAEHLGDQVKIGERHGGLHLLMSVDTRQPEPQLVARCQAENIGLRGASACYQSVPDHPVLLLGFGGISEDNIDEGIERLARVIRSD